MNKQSIPVLVVVFLFSHLVYADLHFDDGGTHIIDYEVSGFLYVHNETTVNLISGGNVEWQLITEDNSQAIIDGGYADSVVATDFSRIDVLSSRITGPIGFVSSLDNSHVAISGGWVEDLCVKDAGQMTLSGGAIVGYIKAGYDTSPPHTGVITIVGTNFTVNDSPVGYGTYFRTDYASGYLSGTLLDGSPLTNRLFSIYDNASIVLSPELPTYTLTICVEPNDIGIDTVVPFIGDHNAAGSVNLSAAKYIDCPDVYQFDYWIGDVEDANSANTTVFMDLDKTVTAVFVATRECGDECHPNDLFGDYNHDCIIDFNDFAAFANNWLVCTKPECD